MKTTIRPERLEFYKPLLTSRPPKTSLPHLLTELGQITFEFRLDFGSFRDIQRHRNGICRMPLLTTELGFHSWYLDQLPPILRKAAEELINSQTEKISSLEARKEIKQYYIALGFLVPCRVTYGLPAAVYVTELRSGRSVHPTLRQVAHQMHYALKERFPILTLHTDLEPDEWSIKRGKEDITKKQQTK